MLVIWKKITNDKCFVYGVAQQFKGHLEYSKEGQGFRI